MFRLNVCNKRHHEILAVRFFFFFFLIWRVVFHQSENGKNVTTIPGLPKVSPTLPQDVKLSCSTSRHSRSHSVYVTQLKRTVGVDQLQSSEILLYVTF